MKNHHHIETVILLLLFLAGLSLLLYPTVSDYWNSRHQSRIITSYAEDVENIEKDTLQKLWQEAEAYNQSLIRKKGRYKLTAQEREEYNSLLNISGNGILGYIEIPSINCVLPIYHGTDKSVLQIAVGHIEGSSLPVGGESTHCVLSGHRGLTSAKLFTDLDLVGEGDVFTLRVLDQVLTYEVDQILIVKPDDVTALEIEQGKDYCTLVTCTPYGVNSHRLLVRGHRIENPEKIKQFYVTADALQIDPLIIAPMVAAPILLVLLLLLLRPKRRK